MNIKNYKRAHFIGIGGAGMSAMAKYFRHHGIMVSGSDASSSEITRDLQDNYDIDFWKGSRPHNISDDIDVVVYSPAVPKTDPELKEAFDFDIQTQSYPELLGQISKDKTTIAISGTNGKTTTTAMMIEVMKYLGEDPTGIVGAQLQKFNSNFISGQSDYFITEACEYKESFLNIYHDVLVITNITEDHLDYFKNLDHIQKTFTKFLHNKKSGGILVCDVSLKNLRPIISEAEKIGVKVFNYQKYINSVQLSIPGEHNKQNAAAVIATIESLGLSVPRSEHYLKKYFQGAKRRMEYIGMTESGLQIFDDYAHNPEGLEYLISGLRGFYPKKKIILLFEPHLYSRTREFKHEFARALEKVDVLYLFPTYKAREPELTRENYLLEQYIDTSKVELISVVEVHKFKQNFEKMKFNNDYIVISAGAGDVWKYSHQLKKTI